MLALDGLAAGLAKLAASAREAHSYTNSFLLISARTFITDTRYSSNLPFSFFATGASFNRACTGRPLWYGGWASP